MFKRGQFELWKYGQGIQGEIRIITDNLLGVLCRKGHILPLWAAGVDI